MGRRKFLGKNGKDSSAGPALFPGSYGKIKFSPGLKELRKGGTGLAVFRSPVSKNHHWEWGPKWE
jgi:hypothetical protein